MNCSQLMQNSFPSLLEGSGTSGFSFLDHHFLEEAVSSLVLALQSIDSSLSNPYYSFSRRAKEVIEDLKRIRCAWEDISLSSLGECPRQQFFQALYNHLLDRLAFFRKIDLCACCSAHEKSKMIFYKQKVSEEIAQEMNALKNFFSPPKDEGKDVIRKRDHSSVSEETVMSCIKVAVEAWVHKNKKVSYGKKVYSSVWILVCYSLGKSPDELPMKAAHCSYINLLLLRSKH